MQQKRPSKNTSLDDEDEGTESFSASINSINLIVNVSTDDSDGDSEDIDDLEKN